VAWGGRRHGGGAAAAFNCRSATLFEQEGKKATGTRHPRLRLQHQHPQPAEAFSIVGVRHFSSRRFGSRGVGPAHHTARRHGGGGAAAVLRRAAGMRCVAWQELRTSTRGHDRPALDEH